ncbi:hypothetical protein Dda_7876 [Drechslerella dactyloides]|uniref:Adenylyl cyclase-associated protein n=1 Tax=Drechslerella dactyloides TaxID=74499 RepID=A0AAD6IRC0_DREDA|nr:hypothetical protein Dda_7876 [Drechslerella dactyloides]
MTSCQADEAPRPPAGRVALDLSCLACLPAPPHPCTPDGNDQSATMAASNPPQLHNLTTLIKRLKYPQSLSHLPGPSIHTLQPCFSCYTAVFVSVVVVVIVYCIAVYATASRIRESHLNELDCLPVCLHEFRLHLRLLRTAMTSSKLPSVLPQAALPRDDGPSDDKRSELTVLAKGDAGGSEYSASIYSCDADGEKNLESEGTASQSLSQAQSQAQSERRGSEASRAEISVGGRTFNWDKLTAFTRRLEAATSRLEDIVTFESQSLGQAPAAITAAVASNNAAAEAGAAAAAVAAAAPRPPSPAPPLPETIEEYDKDVLTLVKQFEDLSGEIGGLIAEQAKYVRQSFLAQRLYLLVSTRAKKPDIASEAYLNLIKDMQGHMNSVNEHREANRASPLYNALSTVSEAVPALAWVTLDTKPAEFVAEMANAGQFYGNRVIKEHKEKDERYVKWVRAWYSICKALEEHVRKHHLRGIVWKKDGGDAQEIMANLKSAGAAPTAAPTSGGPPPPPPPPGPPPPPVIIDAQPQQADGGDMGAVFAQLNQGSNVTAGLRKVDRSEMTHKNPSLRTSSLVSGAAPTSRAKSPGPAAKPKPAHMKQKKPPRMELDGNKWLIENYENEETPIVIDNVEINHSVFVFRCKNTTIQIKGKLNAVSMNECEKANVVLDNLVSSIDVIKSKKFAFQILGSVPTITVDQSDGGTLYVGKESLGIEVYTSKTTAFNVYVPGEREDDDYVECPIPEQIKSSIKGRGVLSEIVEHAG